MYDENDIYAVFEEEAVDLIDRFGQLAESLEARGQCRLRAAGARRDGEPPSLQRFGETRQDARE